MVSALAPIRPMKFQLSAYDFLWSLPCIVVGPIRELRAILEDPAPGLKQFIVDGPVSRRPVEYVALRTVNTLGKKS